MKFKMNNHEWELLEISKENIKELYEKENNNARINALLY